MFELSENDKKLDDLFSHLVRDVMSEAKNEKPISGLDKKLWLLPKATVHYYYNVITDEEYKQVQPLVDMLRSRIVDLINELPDTIEKNRRLSERLDKASSQFRFRPWSLVDIDRYLYLLDNEEMWRYVPENYPDPLTRDIAASLIETSNNLPDRHKVHAVEFEGKPVGQARILFEPSSSDTAEISYWLGQDYWGKGLASKYVALYTKKSFIDNPYLNRLCAKVIEGSVASIRVLEKAGYRYETFEYKNVRKHGKRLSTHVFSIYRNACV